MMSSSRFKNSGRKYFWIEPVKSSFIFSYDLASSREPGNPKALVAVVSAPAFVVMMMIVF